MKYIMNKEVKRYLIVKAYRSGFRRIVTGGDMYREQAERIAEQVRSNPNIVCVEIYSCEKSYNTYPYEDERNIYDYE